MASIARKNLFEDIPRFLVAQAGIMFAVTLVTIQTGLQYGFSRSTSQLIDQSQADLWLASENIEHLGLTLPLPYDRVTQARDVEGVAIAEGVIIRGAVWQDEASDEIASVTLVGANPNGLLFNPDTLTEGNFSNLTQDYSFFTDQTNLSSLELQKIGDTGKINGISAELVGLTEGTQSIVFGNIMFTSLETANALVNGRINLTASSENDNETVPEAPRELNAANPITFILIQAEPGTDLAVLKRRLEEEVPNIRAFTRREMAERTEIYWEKRSGIGFILGLGAVVGVIVGIVVVGQILYASVSDHIKEFGTLKAMGASDWFIYSLIMEQGLWMAVLGYIPGMALCIGVASWTATTQGILILITPGSAIAVLGITVVMCISSAVFAIQKVTRVDPAIVFKG